jgi:hypothetical protein
MALLAVVGQAQALEGREAGAQATHRALEQLGRNPVALGIVIASHYYPTQQVVSGVSTLLGDAPLLGFTTSAEMTREGQSQRSVLVALVSGSDIQARTEWYTGFGDDSRTATQRMVQNMQLYQASGTLLVVADGLNGDAKQMCASLPAGDYALAGCLAGGDLRRARTYQIGGRQSGNGGLAAALLGGKLTASIGMGHGWEQVGAYFKVTRARGPWIRGLDGQSVAEKYAEMFGYQAREWSFPPLNELVRLYPLGIEIENKGAMLVRAALRMEADGSIRMHTTIPEGSTGHLMVGSVERCIAAAQSAAKQALDGLGKVHPALAIVLTDVAWQMLMESQPGREIQAIRGVLGEDVPIIGGYTFGQIARGTSAGLASDTPELFNQHIQVILLGEGKGE